MTATNQPFGCLPIDHNGGGTVRPQQYANFINSGYGTSLSTGQPVILTTSGVINAVAGAGDEIFGIFAGVTYTQTDGNQFNGPNWAANTNATDITVAIWTDPNIVYKIQANGSVPVTGRGACADFVNFQSAANGFSQCGVNAAVSSSGQVRVWDKYLAPDNDFGDAFTVLQVTIAKSQFIAQKSGV